MGVYHYFLRKTHLKASILGSIVPVHAFAYSFKYHYNPEAARRAQFICDNAARVWEGKPLPQFCFNADMPDKADREKGWLAPVYTNLTNYGWVDTGKFPGTCVGGLFVQGRKVEFLNAREYLILEEERRIESMMCSPTQPAIQFARNRIAYLKELYIGGVHPVNSPGPYDSFWNVDELRNGKVILVPTQAPATA